MYHICKGVSNVYVDAWDHIECIKSSWTNDQCQNPTSTIKSICNYILVMMIHENRFTYRTTIRPHNILSYQILTHNLFCPFPSKETQKVSFGISVFVKNKIQHHNYKQIFNTFSTNLHPTSFQLNWILIQSLNQI